MDVAAWVDAMLDAAPAPVRAAADRTAIAAWLASAAIDDGDALAFAAHVGARVDDAAAIPDLAARDLAIAFGCLRRDDRALAAFEDALATARAALARMGAPVDEQLQAVRARLLVGPPPRIADYRGRGSLRRWVRATAVHLYLNEVRDRRREVGIADEDVLDALAGPGSDPQLAYLKERYRATFADALTAAAAAIDPAERLVLRYTHVDGLALDALGRALRVSRATAHRRLTDARAALLTAVERELAARLSLTPEEVVSLHRLVRSQLELSLGKLFA